MSNKIMNKNKGIQNKINCRINFFMFNCVENKLFEL